MRMVVGEFFFLVTKSLKSGRLDLPSNHEICFQNFSFSSRNWKKIADLLIFLQKFSFFSRTRKQVSTFLFFSISLFGISSMSDSIEYFFKDHHKVLKKHCVLQTQVKLQKWGSITCMVTHDIEWNYTMSKELLSALSKQVLYKRSPLIFYKFSASGAERVGVLLSVSNCVTGSGRGCRAAEKKDAASHSYPAAHPPTHSPTTYLPPQSSPFSQSSLLLRRRGKFPILRNWSLDFPSFQMLNPRLLTLHFLCAAWTVDNIWCRAWPLLQLHFYE